MEKTFLVLAAAAALPLAAMPVLAQTDAPRDAAENPTLFDGSPGNVGDQPDLVVEGRRMSESEYRKQIRTFLQETGVAAGETSAARWVQPACPRVVGLSKKQTARVERKLRDVARETGVPLGGERCDANIVVAFTDDAGTVVRTIKKRSFSRLAEVPSTQRDMLLNGDAPVRWWYTTAKTDRFGMPGGVMPVHVRSDQVFEVPGAQHSSMGMHSSSIVSTQVVRSLQTATVVIDAKKASGVPLDTLASYAALVAFAEINARDAAPPGSILGELTTGRAADLTGLDKTFLRSLYGIALDREANAQRRSLLGSMMSHLSEEK